MRIDLERRLQLIGLHPPKRAMDIPEPFAKLYFDLMPIHEKLRGRDYPTTHNYLKVTLCNIHEELTRRMDTNAVVVHCWCDSNSEQVGGDVSANCDGSIHGGKAQRHPSDRP